MVYPLQASKLSRASRIGLLLCGSALALVLAQGTAQAQCSTGNNPAPPPTVNQNIGSLSSPEAFDNSGEGGCQGDKGGVDKSGKEGNPGQPGGQLEVNIGGGAIAANPVALQVTSSGGPGGDGGESGAVVFGNLKGGAGGAGGAGGTVTLNYAGSVTGSDGSLGILVGGQGGSGGAGGNSEGGVGGSTGGNGGSGGQGATVVVQVTGSVITGNVAVLAGADGGDGGNGGSAGFTAKSIGGNGGTGGGGGSASVTVAGTAVSQESSAVLLNANGGDGGNGAKAVAFADAKGGSGGTGGVGGSASATVATGGLASASAEDANALLVQANGGYGGQGGTAGALVGNGGGGGFGGAGGQASATIDGGLQSTGAYGHGALVQSVGGVGGDGNNATGLFFAKGGAGLTGGDGGAVTIGGKGGQVVASGEGAVAILAQSVGGGGGSGGDALDVAVTDVGIAIGGNGGLGGNGADVTVNIDGTLTSTSTKGGGGVLAQSIGGAGGAGGNATTAGFAPVSIAIGGDAKGGGSAGAVTVTNNGIVVTRGDHAAGIDGQSIGGGGGKGGAGVGINANVLAVDVAIGGRGGSGGPAGAASINNNDQVNTYGADSHGLKVQSIGGGGGQGGTAAATAVGLSPDPEIPSISVSVALGGAGGTGNQGGTASIDNAGFVGTAGHGSVAVFAQSVGGGGGVGGDSTAGSFSSGGGVSLSASVAIGGSGGSGAIGGSVNVQNSGLLLTLGESAHGVFGQSVGGGGGTGGTGDASSAATGEDFAMAVSVAVGGKGGSGGTGGQVQVTNGGGIATSGDGSDGIFGQSVGGGGGSAGGGVGKSQGGSLSVSVGVGGSGGAGGNGGEVDVTNNGGIATIGTDSAGITAQSVGGGGGRGGKGGSTAGGAPDNTAQTLASTIANGLGIGQSTQNLGNGVVKVGNGQLGGVTSLGDLGDILGPEGEGDDGDDDGDGTSVQLGVSVGGSGGAAGAGGTIKVQNTGQIGTSGALSDGIFAHSVGGGGGIGGASSGTADNDDATASAAVAIGGSGGAGGAGGQVTLTNDAGTLVTTSGVSANGLVAQSVGGGGGKGRIAAAKDGALASASIAIGGSSSSSGGGGAVTLTNAGTVRTTGKHAIGILAHSVGGGGGIGHMLSIEQTGSQANGNNNPDDYNVSLSFGGAGSMGGDGGAVQVTHTGTVTTTGRNAFGILAQSVGGGGGLAVGGQVTNTTFFLAGDGGPGGEGGAVTVQAGPGGSILTKGDGAIGIWAQSIGGSGGIGGDTAQSTAPLSFAGGNGARGDGGNVTVTMQDALIETSGRNAPGIFAQSIAGGGGQVTTASGAYTGTAGGPGLAGSVSVNLFGGTVSATGVGSAGIHAQSLGQQSNSLLIEVDENSAVSGGKGSGNVANSGDAPGILLDGGNGNNVNNDGTITSVAGTNGTAIMATLSPAENSINNHGTIIGAVTYFGGSTTFENRSDGRFDAGRSVRLGPSGVLVNAGTLAVGGEGRTARTRLTGDLEQTSSGTLHVDLDTADGKADRLSVDGDVALAGTVEVGALSLTKSTVTVLDTTGALDVDPGFAGKPTHLFRFTPAVEDKTVTVRTDADFGGSDGSLSGTRQDVASHLQRIWDSGDTGFGTGFASLAGVDSSDDYADTLDSLSGEAVAAISAARFDASQAMTNSLYSCPAFAGEGTLLQQRDCAWGRIVGSDTDRSSSGSRIGYDWQAVTALVGGQKEVADGWFLGGAVGYEASRLNGDNETADVDGQAGLAAVTVKRQLGRLLLAAGADLGYGWYDSSRTIDLGSGSEKAKASPEAFNAGLHARAAYEVPFANWYLQPRVDLDATYLWLDGYTEDGAEAFDLKVQSSDEVVLSATPALEIGARADMDDGSVIRAYASLGVSLYGSNNWTTDARFADAPSSAGGFQSELDNPNVVAKVTAGVDVLTQGPLDVRLQYDGGFASGYTSNSGTVRLSMRF